MTDQVIVVPKRDELVGVLYAFDIDPNEKSAERLPNGVELWRAAAVPKTTVALLDRQTNTNSGILTLHVINRENPYQIYLVGTALGNPRKAPVASVFVGKSITDISERRPSPDDPFGWQPNGPHASPELTSSASQFVQTHYWSPANRRRFFDDLELPSDLQGEYYERTLKRVRKDLPMISAEQILSGNEYIMTSDRRLGGQSPVWDRYQSYRAYDMEAAGFRLAAESAETPWLVVRGTSDHGTERTRADRVYAAAAAGKVLREFLESGKNNIETIRAPRPKFVGSSLLDLNGLFRGFMGYFDDDNELVVYDETCEFENLGNAVIARIKSSLAYGTAQASLEYSIDFSLAKDHYAAGTWSQENTSGPYFGSLSGHFNSEGNELTGVWTGTHGQGIRIGRFRWYNLTRPTEVPKFSTGRGRNALLREFIATIKTLGPSAGQEYSVE